MFVIYEINTIFAYLPQNLAWDRKKVREALNLLVVLRTTFSFQGELFFLLSYQYHHPLDIQTSIQTGNLLFSLLSSSISVFSHPK